MRRDLSCLLLRRSGVRGDVPGRVDPLVQSAEHHCDADDDNTGKEEADLQEDGGVDQDIEEERRMEPFKQVVHCSKRRFQDTETW